MSAGIDESGAGRRAFLRRAGVAMIAAAGAAATLDAFPAGAATPGNRGLVGPSSAVSGKHGPPHATIGYDLGTIPQGDAFTTHLLRRTTFGINNDLLADVSAAGGAGAWLANQLAPAAIADSVCDAAVARFPKASWDPPQIHAATEFGKWDAMNDLVHATLTRQLWSRRQLFEVMVDFWSNHLNITTPSSEPWATKPADDRTVIRANALGRFDDMLAASVVSPAMMQYLSNDTSTGDAPNENYGREFLELHSVGIGAGYTQDDVVNSARIFTGLSVWYPWTTKDPSQLGTFRYIPKNHFVGAVKVLDFTHPNNDRNAGVQVAQAYARHMANHPATAAHLAAKLAIRFVSDNPPPSLVDKLAQVYLSSQTAIVPVLQTLFASPEFAASVGQKYRRPAEDVIAATRALGIAPSSNDQSEKFVTNMRWQLEGCGNAPLGWAPPNGYPDVAAAWTSPGDTLTRWNVHQLLTNQTFKGGVDYQADLPTYLLGATKPATRGALVDALTARLLPGQTFSANARTAVLGMLGGDRDTKPSDYGGIFPVLVGLILDSPHWSVR